MHTHNMNNFSVYSYMLLALNGRMESIRLKKKMGIGHETEDVEGIRNIVAQMD